MYQSPQLEISPFGLSHSQGPFAERKSSLTQADYQRIVGRAHHLRSRMFVTVFGGIVRALLKPLSAQATAAR